MAELDVDRKVRQLDNDVNAIYGMLDRIAENQKDQGAALTSVRDAVSDVRGTLMRHGNRLDELDAGLSDVRATLARHGNRLDEFDGRFDGLETRFDGLDAKVDRLETRFDGLDAKVDRLETRFDGLDGKLDLVLDRLGPAAAAGDLPAWRETTRPSPWRPGDQAGFTDRFRDVGSGGQAVPRAMPISRSSTAPALTRSPSCSYSFVTHGLSPRIACAVCTENSLGTYMSSK